MPDHRIARAAGPSRPTERHRLLPSRFSLLGLVALTTLLSIPAGPTEGRTATRRIQFAPGGSSAVVKEAVVRGDRDEYLLRARAGETMTVRLTSVERNAIGLHRLLLPAVPHPIAEGMSVSGRGDTAVAASEHCVIRSGGPA